MQSPIPEPGSYKPSETPHNPGPGRGPRPPLLNTLIGIELVIVLLTAVFFQPSGMGLSAQAERVISVVLSLIWMGIIYALWNGANWARILVIIGSVLGVLSVFSIPTVSLPNQILYAFNTVVCCVWIWFLLTRPAIAFTKGTPRN